MTDAPPSSQHAKLSWTDAHTPRSEMFGDVYFSKDDGLAESRAVFLTGCGLPDAWLGRDQFTVAELGFGTGLNIVALIDLWRRAGPAAGYLHIFSVEAYPVSHNEAARALAAWPDVADVAESLLEHWPSMASGFHRINLFRNRVVLDVAIGDAAWALQQWSGQADAWFLDGFAPDLNPGMWSEAVFDGIAARSAAGARLATFTVAGAVRRALSDRGFGVEKRPGHGRKRERLEAVLPGRPPVRSGPQSVIVVGGGIAAASVCRALRALGQDFTRISSHGEAGASGFPAALVTPRLDAGDLAIAGLHAQALERAGDLYRRVPGAMTSDGVLQLETNPRDARRFAQIAVQPIWPEGAQDTLTPSEASERLGERMADGGLMMNPAMSVHPAAVLNDWFDEVPNIAATASAIRRSGSRWEVVDAKGHVIAEADIVVVAAGWGSAALIEGLAIAPVRGQADWVEGVTAPAVAWGGYVAPTPGGLMFGATHDRDRIDTEENPDDTIRNLRTLAARLPDLASQVSNAGPCRGRAAIRATTPDRLPICGEVPESAGMFILTGLGSRGFCLAPLLGEHVASLITAQPSPLARAFVERLAPQRFTSRRSGIAPTDFAGQA